jgi:hypothetical protein
VRVAAVAALLGLGAHAETLLTEIVHRHPRSWYGEVEILFDLLETFGAPRQPDWRDPSR